ncbi:GFA family protein [Phenylobacterium sp.]|uniref:GFA family protein n=1 Tax=Phenylobacterium sp. TaxID=1871053 RepID=UPI0035B44232
MRGSCHCGRIAYTLDETPTQAIECNCSICRRRGSLLAFAAPESFHLKTSRDEISVYTWNRGVIRHQFCKTCGCAPFAEGVGPNGPMVAINLRCAKDLDLATVAITPFDGAHKIRGPADAS